MSAQVFAEAKRSVRAKCYGVFSPPSRSFCCRNFTLGETCPCLSPEVCSCLPERRGDGEESLNAKRLVRAAGQFAVVSIIQLCVIFLVVVYEAICEGEFVPLKRSRKN